MTNWAGGDAPKPEQPINFEVWEWIGKGWKKVDPSTITIKDILDGPYVVKAGEKCLCGNEEVFAKMEGRLRDWSFKYFQELFNPLVEKGIPWKEVLPLTFRHALNCLDSLEVFGGTFINKFTVELGEKGKCLASPTQTFIPF